MDEQKPNFELLKDAYEIIDGIPNRNINLNCWVRGDEKRADCGTSACAAGWLALHPKFQALGLKMGSSRLFGSAPTFRGKQDYEALGLLFGIGRYEAASMFGPLYGSGGDYKAVFLQRVSTYLQQHGQLKGQLATASAA